MTGGVLDLLKQINAHDALVKFETTYTDDDALVIASDFRSLCVDNVTGADAYRALARQLLRSPVSIEALDKLLDTALPGSGLFSALVADFIRAHPVAPAFYIRLRRFLQVLGVLPRNTKKKVRLTKPKFFGAAETRGRFAVKVEVEKALLAAPYSPDELTSLYVEQGYKVTVAQVQQIFTKLKTQRIYMCEEDDGRLRLHKTKLWYQRNGEEVPDGAPEPRKITRTTKKNEESGNTLFG